MLSIVIPTFRRERVLLDTLALLHRLDPAPFEILVIDQTPRHRPDTEQALAAMAENGVIRHIRIERPSIPVAMNRGLLEARGDIVLFLDDDIVPDAALVAAHRAAHAKQPGRIIAGRVIQPWQEGKDFCAEEQFHFATTRQAQIDQFMGGNFSLRRSEGLDLGGFDQNFVQVAYCFEVEFAHRWLRSGRSIHFEPRALIHHLKAAEGGTRSYGEHLTTWLPAHSVGAYYHLLRTWRGMASARAFLKRPLGAVATRFHLRHPWRIPPTLLSEALGAVWALWLAAKGPVLIRELDRARDV